MPDWNCEGSLDQAKRDALIRAVRHCDGNLVAAAERLKIGRSTIYRMIADLGVDLKNLPSEPAPREAPPRQAGRLVQVGGDIFMIR